jgi:hypothetical protein
MNTATGSKPNQFTVPCPLTVPRLTSDHVVWAMVNMSSCRAAMEGAERPSLYNTVTDTRRSHVPASTVNNSKVQVFRRGTLCDAGSNGSFGGVGWYFDLHYSLSIPDSLSTPCTNVQQKESAAAIRGQAPVPSFHAKPVVCHQDFLTAWHCLAACVFRNFFSVSLSHS